MTSLIGRSGESYCNTLNYVLHHISEHLSKAEPSGDLREALLNTCYTTFLTKLELFDSNIPGLLADFFSFLKVSVSIHCLYSISLTRFTVCRNLQIWRISISNIYDKIMRRRIADVSLDLGSIVGLALKLGLHPTTLLRFNESFKAHFPAVEGGPWRIYQTLSCGTLGYLLSSDSRMLLKEFLTDPGRAGSMPLTAQNALSLRDSC